MVAIRRNDKNAALQSTLSNGRPDYDEMLDGRASIAAYRSCVYPNFQKEPSLAIWY